MFTFCLKFIFSTFYSDAKCYTNNKFINILAQGTNSTLSEVVWQLSLSKISCHLSCHPVCKLVKYFCTVCTMLKANNVFTELPFLSQLTHLELSHTFLGFKSDFIHNRPGNITSNRDDFKTSQLITIYRWFSTPH